MQFLQSGFWEKTSGHAGLVGDNHNLEPALVQKTYRLTGSGDELHLLDGVHISHFLADGSVTV
jgi:hypothetical protein